jgi:ABC-type transport system substrate-binding protein
VTRVTTLRTGEVDFANYLPREYIERLNKDPQIRVLKGMDTQRVGTFLNRRKAPFTDAWVRRALLGFGIDRHAIAKTALWGQAQALWSFVPPGGKDHIDFGEQFPYDSEKAKALLKEAGFDAKIRCATPA